MVGVKWRHRTSCLCRSASAGEAALRCQQRWQADLPLRHPGCSSCADWSWVWTSGAGRRHPLAIHRCCADRATPRLPPDALHQAAALSYDLARRPLHVGLHMRRGLRRRLLCMCLMQASVAYNLITEVWAAQLAGAPSACLRTACRPAFSAASGPSGCSVAPSFARSVTVVVSRAAQTRSRRCRLFRNHFAPIHTAQPYTG